ncbi:methyl-accepting chemotaxis protein [Microcoleus sp. OTE_8_concoct_300]|uniref:methyl-accepting chemotaxis protein n=1 Tax=Microcoleus sp. OTE_8_concoct_300 TaxID=2964710 RepID=UPI00403F3A41
MVENQIIQLPNPKGDIAMFANLKLRNRMLLGYAVPIALFVGLVAPVFSSASKVAESYRQTKISLTAIEGTDYMSFYLAKMVGETRGYLLIKDGDFLNAYQKDLQAFQEVAELVGRTIENPIQKERLKKLIDLQKQYDDFSKQMINLVKQGKQKEALEVFATKKGTLIINEFNELNRSFNEKEHEILDAATSNAEENIRFLIAAVLVGAVLGIAIALLAAFLISSGIAKTISDAVNAIASSSTEIAATVEQQERTATQQSSSVNQTTITMDELGAASQQSAQQAQAGAESARQALNIAERGTLAVDQTLESMTRLKENVGAIAAEILRLSEQTNQIGNISTAVTDIANQTNMLALNASVEAVRAGENAQGFTVIATEIRKLADQSKKSAEKINNLVFDIKNAIESTVMVTKEGTKTVEEGTKISQETAAAFSEVAKAVNNVVLNNQQISLTAEQQAVAIQQVVDAMNSLNQSAKETASGITQTKLGTQQLKEAAQNLNSIV